MPKTIDFSSDVGGPGTPASPDGNLLIKAGATVGQANELGGVTQGKLLETGGNLALDAAKGYLLSGLEKDITRTVDAYDARVKVDEATATIDLFKTGMGVVQPPEVDKAMADIEKYKTALDQGIMTRDQALLAIDKSVKEYSRTMPGWAADFRKKGYELTGIEHLGGYAAFANLSKQSAQDKLRYDALKFALDIQQKQVTMFVEKYGRLPTGGLDGEDMAIFRQQLAINARAESLQRDLQIRDATIQQNEPKVVNYINTRMADGIMTLNTLMQGLVTGVDPKTGKAFSTENKIVIRENLLAQVNKFFENTKSELAGFNANQVSNGTRDSLMNRLNTQQRELVDSLKNQDSFDAFRKTMELRASEASDVMNKWSIANPHLKIIKESGIATPEVARLWIDSQRDPRRQADFRRIYGGALDDYFKSITTGGQTMFDYHSNNMSAASQSEDAMNALKLTNPGAHMAAVQGLRDHIKAMAQLGWGETPDMQELRKSKFADNIRVFTSQISMADESSVREYTNLMSDPRVAQRISELPQPALASAPIIQKTRDILENPEFGVLARLQRIADKTNMTYKQVSMELIQDPLSGQIKVKYTPFQGVAAAGRNEGDPNTKSRMAPNRSQTQPIIGDGSQVPNDGPEIKRLVDTTNRAINTMNNFTDALPGDLKGGNLSKDILQKFTDGYFGMNLQDRTNYLGGQGEQKGKDKSSKGPMLDQKEFNDVANANFGPGTAEGDPERMKSAAKIRLAEVGGNPAVVDRNIAQLEGELKVPNLNGTSRQIIKRELSFWQLAKELLAVSAMPNSANAKGEGNDKAGSGKGKE